MRLPVCRSGQQMPGDPCRPKLRPVVWIDSSRDDISGMSALMKVSFSLRVFKLQQGGAPLDVKMLPQFGAGVCELRESFDGDAYQTVYVVSLEKALYVLHAFMKKSMSDIGLPRPDKALIEARLKRARELDREGDQP